MGSGSAFGSTVGFAFAGALLHMELVGIVHETLENGVGERRVAADLTPLVDGSRLVTTVEGTPWRSLRASAGGDGSSAGITRMPVSALFVRNLGKAGGGQSRTRYHT